MGISKSLMSPSALNLQKPKVPLPVIAQPSASLLRETEKVDKHGYKVHVDKTGKKISHDLIFLYRMAEEAREQ
jgi:hypothetical protein